MYKYTRNYYGPVKACVFDWSGTLIDKWSLAPVNSLIDTFKEIGITATPEEIRDSMGIRKDQHIKEILKLPNIRPQWLKYSKDKEPTQDDYDILMELYKRKQLESISDYTELIPNVKTTISKIRGKHRIKIAGTTGFTKAISDVIIKDVKKQGLFMDAFVSGDEVYNGSRPNPFMLFKCLELLNIPEMKSVVKFDDTVSGIEEGLNAGCWTVGITKWSNYMNVNTKEDEDKLLNNTKDFFDKINECNKKFSNAGAHYVVDNFYEITAVIKDINKKLSLGIKP
tara:strand:+ start:286 stop:1131 length:846 start_codon:yes stop_codon:yes gene_type:complete